MKAAWAVLAAALAATPAAAPAAAQQRRILASDHPQAQVMGYYAAVMAFTASALPDARWDVGGELTFIPSLSDAERRVGFGGTKSEDTNLCPVFPRLRAARAFGAAGVELGWTPPVPACGVTASIVSAAGSWRVPVSPAFQLGFRAHVLAGSLAAAITCGAEAVADPSDQVCFQGAVSEDRVRPLTVGADLLLVHSGPHHPGLTLYAALGVRRERMRFDVNFANPSIAFEDHERLESSFTRAHAALGGTLALTGRLGLGGELFWAPGALTTMRGRARWAFGRLR